MLFFMWGFLTCLNDILIPHLKGVFDLNYTQIMLIQFTFFGAYFIMSIPSGSIIAKLGYQKGIVVGLLTAGVGALLFYPAAAAISYPLFLTALFVLASGITLLQVAANPYVAVLGRADTASSRLNLTQAFNSLGTTIAPYFGGVLILSSVAGMTPLQEAEMVQMPYVGLAVALAVLAVVIWRSK
ncbi:MAG: MFS transporter, partial [Bacteroidota bacterium]